jgi:hypothetical protein
LSAFRLVSLQVFVAPGSETRKPDARRISTKSGLVTHAPADRLCSLQEQHPGVADGTLAGGVGGTIDEQTADGQGRGAGLVRAWPGANRSLRRRVLFDDLSGSKEKPTALLVSTGFYRRPDTPLLHDRKLLVRIRIIAVVREGSR